MKDTVFVVWDTACIENRLVSIHKTLNGARAALLGFLKSQGAYTADEWKFFAEGFGYSTTELFQDAILESSRYDEDMNMWISWEKLEY